MKMIWTTSACMRVDTFPWAKLNYQRLNVEVNVVSFLGKGFYLHI